MEVDAIVQLHHPAGTVLALVDAQRQCHGFGRIRPCLLRQGSDWRIGPLLADSPELAERLLRDLDLEGVVRARKPQRLPVVLTQEEVRLVLQQLEGSEALVAGLLYGRGLRLMEALRLRVHDLDFNRQELTVRNGKGGKDRRTMLPKQLAKKLQIHLEKVRTVHKRDLIDGWGAVQLPYALARKYRNAATEWGW